MMQRSITTIDVGGTYFRSATWIPGEGLCDRMCVPTPTLFNYPDREVSLLQSDLIEMIARTVPKHTGAVVAISFGAAINHFTGTVYASAPLWGDYSIPLNLLNVLKCRRGDVNWTIVNDVTAAALDIVLSPLCANDRKVMVVTVSTGIAARTIECGSMRIPLDASGLQGEIGHLPAVADLSGEPVLLQCDCGRDGHLASYSSGRGLLRMANTLRERDGRRWFNSTVGELSREGSSFPEAFRVSLEREDGLAKELLAAVTAPISAVMRTALCLDPDIDRIVLTGGVACSLGHFYRDAVVRHLENQGLYLTSDLSPNWVTDRVALAEADCLAGAAIAARRWSVQ